MKGTQKIENAEQLHFWSLFFTLCNNGPFNLQLPNCTAEGATEANKLPIPCHVPLVTVTYNI